jgi:Protein of unknown function, DUF547
MARPPNTAAIARNPAPSMGRTIAAGLTGLLAIVGVSVGLAQPASAGLSDLAKPSAGSKATVDHSSWDGLLKTYVSVGADGLNRVDYRNFKANGHAALKAYVKQLETTKYRDLGRSELFAFWANLYNAKTIDIVLDHYPVQSIKDINLGGSLAALVTGGPWKAKTMKVGGTELSLDDVEHRILRPGFQDPRVHYAVNCASIGCPNLQVEAFTGNDLEAQLEQAAKDYVNHPRGIQVSDGKVKASSIYSWFQEDFGGNERGVLNHVRKFAAPALKVQLRGKVDIADYDYDWRLNDVK